MYNTLQRATFYKVNAKIVINHVKLVLVSLSVYLANKVTIYKEIDQVSQPMEYVFKSKITILSLQFT